MFTFCDVLHETKQKAQTNYREREARTGNHLETTEMTIAVLE